MSVQTSCNPGGDNRTKYLYTCTFNREIKSRTNQYFCRTNYITEFHKISQFHILFFPFSKLSKFTPPKIVLQEFFSSFVLQRPLQRCSHSVTKLGLHDHMVCWSVCLSNCLFMTVYLSDFLSVYLFVC